jgi:hypothetical protein
VDGTGLFGEKSCNQRPRNFFDLLYVAVFNGQAEEEQDYFGEKFGAKWLIPSSRYSER